MSKKEIRQKSSLGEALTPTAGAKLLSAVPPSAHAIKLQNEEDANSPIPHMTLHSFRFLALVVIGAAVVAGALVGISRGVPVDRDVGDPIGSSETADTRVELYQTFNGFFWAAVGLVLEEFFNIFLAVMTTYFANRKWHPADRPAEGNGVFKRTIIFWFTPVMMYVMNIGLSSVFVEHKFVRIERRLVDEDLVAMTLAVDNRADAPNSIFNTVLAPAVRGYVVPYSIDPTSGCGVWRSNNLTSGKTKFAGALPPVTKIKSTSTSFGFLPREWNADVLPYAVEPTTSIEFQFGQLSNETEAQREERFAAYREQIGMTSLSFYNMMLQGLTLHDMAVTESNAWNTHPCTLFDHLEDSTLKARKTNTTSRRLSRQRRLDKRNESKVDDGGDDEDEEEDEDEDVTAPQKNGFPTIPKDDDKWGEDYYGLRECAGVGSSLWAVSKLKTSKDRTLSKVMAAITEATEGDNDYPSGLGTVLASQASVRIETVALTSNIEATSITLNIPYPDDAEYRLVSEEKCEDRKFKKAAAERAKYKTQVEFEVAQEKACDPSYVPYDDPRMACGASTCVFKDESTVFSSKKQLLMVPYQVSCDANNLTYNHDLSAWFPSNCSSLRNNTFIYGQGSYVTGSFTTRVGKGPVIRDARRHLVLTFMRLQWKFEDVSARFGAECDVEGGCDGLIFPLEKSDSNKKRKKHQVLVLGSNSLPQSVSTRKLGNPIQLVSLNSPKFFYHEDEAGSDDGTEYYVWDHLDLNMLDTNYKLTDGLGLNDQQCSLVIDSYLNQVEANHYYINNPVQAMYTSAIYYLFQNSTVKDVELGKNSVLDMSKPILGRARMKGDKEKKEIRYSIPLASAVSTGTGIIALLVYLWIVLKWPRDPVQLTDETNFPAQYAQVLIDDNYPKRVHSRKLKLPTGEVVNMDDYGVDRIIFSHRDQPDSLIVMG